jgi:uroporphyrinogen-III decarboxylase
MMNQLSNRQRIRNTITGDPVDRPPFFLSFGPWGETIERWRTEGLPQESEWTDGMDFDEGIETLLDVNLGYCPAFEYCVLEERGDKIIFRDDRGITQMANKSGASIPAYLDYPVKDRASWLKMKERLNPEDPARFPTNWTERAKICNLGDHAIQVGSYPWGLFGTLREMMGFERLMFAFCDEPDLVHEIMDYLADFWLVIYEKVCRDVAVDIIHIWEDMSGKCGSLISPRMVRDFMLPNYQKIRSFADAHGVAGVSLDTDGNCSELVPLFLEGGIRLVMPFEVAAGCDILEYKRKYPELAIMGGIDKREIAKGPEAIDRELVRIAPMFKSGRYFAGLDHLVHPQISWQNFQYFTSRLKELIGA